MKGSSHLRYVLYATAFVSALCPNAMVRGRQKTVERRLIDELQLPFVTNAVATTTDNRLFLNVSHLDGSAGPRVVEWRDGKAKPYPDETWNEKASSVNAGSHLVLVNSLRIGPDGDLWLVDVGSPDFGEPTLPHGPKLVQVDIARNVVRRVYDLTPLTSAKSFVDDVRFHGRTAYLSERETQGLSSWTSVRAWDFGCWRAPPRSRQRSQFQRRDKYCATRRISLSTSKPIN